MIIGVTREMACTTFQTIALPRFTNVSVDLIGGYNQTNQTPQWSNAMVGIVMVYWDFLGPIAFMMLFSMPFLMIWLSHGNMKIAAIVGIILSSYVLVFLPGNLAMVAGLCVVISVAVLVWSLVKP